MVTPTIEAGISNNTMRLSHFFQWNPTARASASISTGGIMPITSFTGKTIASMGMVTADSVAPSPPFDIPTRNIAKATTR